MPTNNTEILQVSTSLNPQSEVLLLHGMTGSPEELLPVARYISEHANARVWLPRLAGHKEFGDLRVTRSSEWVDQLNQIIEAITAKAACPLKIVGLSFGGLLAMLGAQRYSSIIDRIVVIAPPFRLRSAVQEGLLTVLSRLPEFFLSFLWKVKKTKLDLAFERKCFSSHWVGAIGRLAKIRRKLDPRLIKCPVLLIGDRFDHQVSDTAIEEAAKDVEKATVSFFDHGTHELMMGPRYKDVWVAIVNFLNGN